MKTLSNWSLERATEVLTERRSMSVQGIEAGFIIVGATTRVILI